ncbi:DUF3168 domain-containing protein [Tropicibacter sp. Alg240-R139]|uniref:DUF3168 domain-containing protein n=1 Tax=Tropicibacter sp. Alg240-R139 TaxID=2305991 RepID=UPI0013E06594|nr:DUF3168 domain-containing protein [Tropicibacter sp. Alg240-R139]
MSYGAAAALQSAVYQVLQADSQVDSLIGDAIYDALPTGTLPQTYVLLGPEDVRDASDQTGQGARHRFTVTVMSEVSGFAAAKELAVAIGDALRATSLTLTRGRVVGLWFDRATAKKTGSTGQFRQIDLRFHARVEDN